MYAPSTIEVLQVQVRCWRRFWKTTRKMHGTDKGSSSGLDASLKAISVPIFRLARDSEIKSRCRILQF